MGRRLKGGRGHGRESPGLTVKPNDTKQAFFPPPPEKPAWQTPAAVGMLIAVVVMLLFVA